MTGCYLLMDIRFLTTFIEVVNTRHFGKAAENLYLTQSAVSARIKLLEEYFHTTLFIRQRNSIQLTQSGEKLLPYAKQLCKTLKEARDELSEATSEYIVVGATQLTSELILPAALRQFHNAYEDWSIKAEVLSLDSLSRQVHERSVDIAFSTEPLKSEEVDSRVICTVDLMLYSANSTAAPGTDDFIAIDWGSKVRDTLLTQYPSYKDAKLRTNSLQLAVNTLVQEGGIALLPKHSEKLMPGAASLTPLAEAGGISVPIYLHAMKVVKRSGVSEVIDTLRSNGINLTKG